MDQSKIYVKVYTIKTPLGIENRYALVLDG